MIRNLVAFCRDLVYFRTRIQCAENESGIMKRFVGECYWCLGRGLGVCTSYAIVSCLSRLDQLFLLVERGEGTVRRQVMLMQSV